MAMTRFSRLALVLLSTFGLGAAAATAGPGFSVSGMVVQPANVPDLVAAFEKLSKAEVLKGTKNRASLQAHVADGSDPTTHSFVIVFPSEAEAEATAQRVTADPAWAEFTATLARLGAAPGTTTRYQTLRSWGEISDADVVWENFAFDVRDWTAFIAATDRFMTSAPGKAGPGQVHVIATNGAGLTPANAAIVVGWESMAEREAWHDKYDSAAEWRIYGAEAALSADALGMSLVRLLASSGASLHSTLGR
jgi:hypothetical protein